MVISGLNLANLDGENGFIIPGSYSNGTISTGDINGDNFSDLIISGSANYSQDDDNKGNVFVIFGSESGWETDLASLNGKNGFTISGIDRHDGLGEAVASGGDLNGDGFDDLVVSSPDAGKRFSKNGLNLKSQTGEVYVIFGKEKDFNVRFDLTTLNGNNGFTIPGINNDDRFGNAVDSVGDINGDGFDDLVVSGKYSREAHVIFGSQDKFDARFDLTSLNGNNGFTIPDIAGVYHVSSSFSHAGDLNGDGFDDLAISSLEDEKVYVIFGTDESFDAKFDLTTLDGNNGFAIASIEPKSRLGDSVSNAGDLNGDGFSDLIIGDPWSAANSDEYSGLGRGKAYVIFGKETGFDADFDLTSLDGDNGFSITGIDIDDNLGDAVSNAGDLDGDGFDDLIISAPSAEESIKLSEGYSDGDIQGEVYVIFGTEAGFNANLDLKSLNGENGFAIESVDEGSGFESGFGSAINSGGDFNGDGLHDLMIDAGYVVFGSPDLKKIRTIEESPIISNPLVTILNDENDGDLSENDISLREAILYSNDGDTIDFDASLNDGTILLTLGELKIDKNLTIQGFADSELTIDGNNSSRVFNVDDNFSQIVDVTLENLTITGGNAVNSSGGGIRNKEKLTVNNSIITGNSARTGGGVDNSFSWITINNSIVSDNYAEVAGGGIYNSSNKSWIKSLNLNNSVVSDNLTNGSGAGIDNNSSWINIKNSTIKQNEAKYNGGGISSDRRGTVDISNSTISNNQADKGAGINASGSFDFAYSTIVNSTISGNVATTQGGGIYKNSDSNSTIINSTVTDNSAPSGAGIYQQGYSAYSSVSTITSSIIAGNANDLDLQGANLASGGNNLIGNGDDNPNFINLINGDLVGTTNEPLDPQLGELKDNGGLTFTHALLPESIAINTGSNPEELTTDQRGAGFERVLFDAPDIGSFEANTDSIYDLPLLPPEPMVRIVTTLDDEDDGNLSAEDLSLREALLVSNPGDTITFDPSFSDGKIALKLGELVVNKSLTIQGLGANNLTIDGNNDSRVFNIDNASNTKIDVTIEQLTISGGNAADLGGGGIINQENLIVNDSIISDSLAKRGGGISSDDYATTTINNSTITNNVAGSGGGVSRSSATTIINNSTISGNVARERDGGGIDSVTPYGGPTIVNNSTISGNSANRYGGGIFGFDSTVEINNSTITGNTAKNEGSGIYLSGGTVTSTIIAGNANNDDIFGDGAGFISGGNNLIGNGEDAEVFTNGIKQDLVGTAANPIDPRLGGLQDNGGLTFTHALLSDSPAINAGSNPEELTTDQRGGGFERVLFDAIDIGAFEADTDSIYAPRVLPPDPVVTILEDENDGDLSAGDVSLREAILYSDAGDTIGFDSSLSSGTINLTLGELVVEKDLIIQGLGADNLTIDANRNSRVLRVDDASHDDSIDVTLDGVTITGGFADDKCP